MTKTYELKTYEDGTQALQMTDENGQVWGVPMVAGNSDYENYLNPVEHLTEIPTKEAYLATLASELSNPSTPQAGE